MSPIPPKPSFALQRRIGQTNMGTNEKREFFQLYMVEIFTGLCDAIFLKRSNLQWVAYPGKSLVSFDYDEYGIKSDNV